MLALVAVILWAAGNIIAGVRAMQTNSLPDPLFLVADAAVTLYVLAPFVTR